MFRYLGLTERDPLFFYLGEVIYYGFIAAGALLAVIQLHRWLVRAGYDAKSVTRFISAFALALAPATYLGSRFAGLVGIPLSEWSFDVVLEAFSQEGTHTYHASIILPFLVLTVLIRIWRFRFFQVMDIIFLHLPLVHALGRIGCFAVGCCWGRIVFIDLFGWQLRFQNPMPLYSIGVNLLIFAVLRRVFVATQHEEETGRRYEGLVFGGYLVLYGVARLIIEVFRPQRPVWLELTQAQLVMLAFIAIGAIVCWSVGRRAARPLAAATDPGPVAPCSGAQVELQKLLPLLGVVLTYLTLVFVFHHLMLRVHLMPPPFYPTISLGDAYTRVLYGLLLALPGLLSIYWMRRAGLSLGDYFGRPRFSRLFLVALAVSAFYAVDLLFLRGNELRGGAFWPPVILLSAINATSEEVMHRVAALSLLLQAQCPVWLAVLLQALLYGLVHLFVTPTLGALAIVYGLILGALALRSGSVIPAIICHFVIDLGAIGLPVLHRIEGGL